MYTQMLYQKVTSRPLPRWIHRYKQTALVSHRRRHRLAAPSPFCDWFPISGENLVHGVRLPSRVNKIETQATEN